MENMRLKIANNILIEAESAKECSSFSGSLALIELLTRDAVSLAELVIVEEKRKNKRMDKVLLIDDIRTEEMLRSMGHNLVPTSVVRNYDDAIRALTLEGPFDVVYLDHDLGEDEMAKTGYGIMNFLESNTEFLPGKIILVTSNPVGRKQMEVVINRLYGNKE